MAGRISISTSTSSSFFGVEDGGDESWSGASNEDFVDSDGEGPLSRGECNFVAVGSGVIDLGAPQSSLRSRAFSRAFLFSSSMYSSSSSESGSDDGAAGRCLIGEILLDSGP